MLLSSLGGAAIKSVRIEGVAHEFSTIPGVKEDVTDIVLNLKDIVVRMHTDADEVEAPLVATRPRRVTAKDIDLPAGVEILNPERPDRDAREEDQARDLPDDRPRPRLLAGRGQQDRGPADRRDPDRLDLLADPARLLLGRLRPRRPAHRLRQAHARDRDRRLVEPGSALREAAEILIKSLAIFTDADRVEELTSRDGAGAAEAARPRLAAVEGDDRLIEELEIGVRAYNCLKRAGIQTVGDLVQKSESELNAIPNFGKRSIDEVKEALNALGLSSATSSVAAARGLDMRHGKTAPQAQPRLRASQGAAPNLCREVIEHERIKTSQAKAKAVKPEVEKLITLAKRGDLHARRQALSALGQDKFIVHKLFEEVAPRYAERPGGYTRIVKLGPRRSDSTEMVFLELV